MIDGASAVTSIRLLTAQDAEALLGFEQVNRDWFRALVPDRGDAYFEDFATRHQRLLDEQRDGTARFWLVVDGHGVLVGRVNLVDITAGSATLGYRIGREHAGGVTPSGRWRSSCGRRPHWGWSGCPPARRSTTSRHSGS